MNHCDDCNKCGINTCVTPEEIYDNGYVKFRDDPDNGMWFHGIVYNRAKELEHLTRTEAMQIIRKEFGIGVS